MSQIEVSVAQANLRDVIERARGGENVTLVDQGRAVARVLPILDERAAAKPPRRLGVAEGKFVVPDDFDAPLPDDVLELFYEGPIFPEVPTPNGDPKDRA